MQNIVKIGKRDWLTGLSWSSFENKPTKEDISEDARRLNASWVAVRTNDSCIQAGFCNPPEGAKTPSKLYSLAAMLADSHEQPWAGIFKLDENLWWYIAVRDGHAILPNGDVVGDEQTIATARDLHSGYKDWKYVDGDIEKLKELIAEVETKPTPIRALNRRRRGLGFGQMVGVAVILLATALGGGYYWQQRSKAMEDVERIAMMAKLRVQLDADAGKKVVAPEILLLASSPEPNTWLSACGKAITAIQMSSWGWTPTQVSCEDKSAYVMWKRGEGATVGLRPDGDLVDGGDTVNQVINLDLPGGKSRDSSISLSDERLALREWAQAAGFSLTLGNPVVVMPGIKPEPKKEQASSKQEAVSMEIPVSPLLLNMSSIPGLRVSKVVFSNNKWRVDGTLYGR